MSCQREDVLQVQGRAVLRRVGGDFLQNFFFINPVNPHYEIPLTVSVSAIYHHCSDYTLSIWLSNGPDVYTVYTEYVYGFYGHNI